MYIFTLETGTMNTILPEIVHKSVEVKHECVKPSHLEFCTSFRKIKCMFQVLFHLYFTFYRQVHSIFLGYIYMLFY